MALYRVQLRGENFLLNLSGEVELLGFDVTYFVQAETQAEAIHIATIRVRQNQDLSKLLQNTPENPTRITCKSIDRVWWRRAGLDGKYSYWPMESGDLSPL